MSQAAAGDRGRWADPIDPKSSIRFSKAIKKYEILMIYRSRLLIRITGFVLMSAILALFFSIIIGIGAIKQEWSKAFMILGLFAIGSISFYNIFLTAFSKIEFDLDFISYQGVISNWICRWAEIEKIFYWTEIQMDHDVSSKEWRMKIDANNGVSFHIKSEFDKSMYVSLMEIAKSKNIIVIFSDPKLLKK